MTREFMLLMSGALLATGMCEVILIKILDIYSHFKYPGMQAEMVFRRTAFYSQHMSYTPWSLMGYKRIRARRRMIAIGFLLLIISIAA